MQISRLRHCVRAMVVEAFADITVPTEAQLRFAESYLPVAWEFVDGKFQPLPLSDPMSQQFFAARDQVASFLCGKRWEQVSWKDCRDLHFSNVSTEAWRYYVQSSILIPQHQQLILNDSYEWTILSETDDLTSLLELLSGKQVEALFAYVTVLALEGDGQARSDITDFWAPYRWVRLGKKTRIW